MSDQKLSRLANMLVCAAALLILAAGVTGAVLLHDWRVAKLGLIAAMVAYLLAFLLAVIPRNLHPSKPVRTVAETGDRSWRRHTSVPQRGGRPPTTSRLRGYRFHVDHSLSNGSMEPDLLDRRSPLPSPRFRVTPRITRDPRGG